MPKFYLQLLVRLLCPSIPGFVCMKLAQRSTTTHFGTLLIAVILLGNSLAAYSQTGACTTPAFAAATTFGPHRTPFSITSADLNLDGRLDIITQSNPDNT